MELDVMTMVTQFGVAGLIAWMWLSERRAGATRERQLSEAHEHVMQQRVQLESLVQIVRENTSAMTVLSEGQRTIAATLRRALHEHEVAAERTK